ncbi:hypothetical protein WG904_01175 [Pedobacter sp. Du54]|uniref:hypothetical protein n=1 Tax=Pedobacter anseongensis TaxID=3133439 RepID=UPI0030B5C272
MFKKVFFLFILLIPIVSNAQSVLTGNIFDYANRSISLEGATVKNLTSKSVTLTDKDGHYVLSAKIGDLVSFGMVGYQTDTVYLINLFPKNVYLRFSVNNLNTVNISGAKLSRFLDLKDPTAMPSRQVDYSKERGGLRLNLGFGKFKREREKVSELEEYDQFNEEISRNFTVDFVKNLLKIDSADLKNFMGMYRPTVAQIKSERPFNYELYTAQCYSTWIKLPPDQRKPPSLLKAKGDN